MVAATRLGHYVVSGSKITGIAYQCIQATFCTSNCTMMRLTEILGSLPKMSRLASAGLEVRLPSFRSVLGALVFGVTGVSAGS